jgi:TPR repeat protein
MPGREWVVYAAVEQPQERAVESLQSMRPTMSEKLNDPDYSSGVAAFEAKNFIQAMQFLYPLAEAGNADAQHRVAIMCQNGLGVVRNDKRAFEMMKAAAEQGYDIAQHGLGFMYLMGECVEKDGAQAAKWFRKAADQGLAGSLTTLAMMYEEGNGVEKDQEEAKRLYARAGFDL